MAVTGAKAHADRLRRLNSPATIERIGRGLFKAGLAIQTEAQRLITEGAVSGKGHVASKPGEPPNNDTSNLKNNIETTRKAPLRVEVASNARYAVALERGTSRMAARPYMAPAVARKREEVSKYIHSVIENAIGGSGGE